MPGNHSRPRRQFSAAGEDDDGASSFSLPRGDDSRAEPYSHSRRYSHASDSRRQSPSAKSDMRNDVSSSSRRRDVDDWRQADDRYTYSPSKDGHRRGGRDDVDDRDSDSWPPPRDTHHNTTRQWEHYDQDYDDRKSSSQKESWTPRYDNRDRDSGFSRWTPKHNRNDNRGDRNRKTFTSRDPRVDSWGRDEPRETYNERRRDNGWPSRRRSNTDDNAQSVFNEPLPSNGAPSERYSPEERWGPASRNDNRNDNQGHRDRKVKHHNKNKKGKKHNEKKPRDWRNDDGHLNKYVEVLLFLWYVV